MQGQRTYHRRARMTGDARLQYRSARRYNPSERMNVSVNDTGRENDWYGRGAMGVLGLGFSGSLNQPVTDRFNTREVPVVSAGGVRSTVAHVVLALLIFVLGVSMITNLVDLKAAGDQVNAVRRDIEAAQKINAAREQELVNKANGINVGYEAARLGMVSAKSVETIYLTLPEIMPTFTADTQNVNTGYLAANLGD